ncbi:MAG: GIY-YIG nuclease family protein [Methylocella sp.]
MWRDNRPAFESYQSTQRIENRPKFARATVWASFVGTPDGATMFVGMYAAKYNGLLAQDTPWPHADGIDLAGSCDVYDLRRDERTVDFEGKLFIAWGAGALAWVQRADHQNKAIVELRPEFKEAEFPGFLNLIAPLSKVASFPKSWIEVLKNATGVYLLTCPRTKEQYVGSAYGSEGFWHRWMDYAMTGHGGNVALKSREPSDYQVSILELAGSNLQIEDIVAMEARWKRKLQSGEMGLTRN